MRLHEIQDMVLAAQRTGSRAGPQGAVRVAATLPRQRLLAVLLAGGGFMLAASAASADGGDTQATATCIGSLPYNDSGTTVGKVDDYNLPADVVSPTLTATCANSATGAGPAGSLPRGAIYTGTGTAPDAVYRLDFPAGNADNLIITMDPTGAQDLSLIVYCDTISSNLSDGLVIDDTGVGGVAESVSLGGVTAGTSLYIVVDGYSTGATPPGPSGPYNLSITSSGSVQPDPTCGAAPQADLSITKSDGVASATPGDSTTYTIVASNAGPSNATGATVADTFPAACDTANWTCVGAGGGTCTAAGSGSINDAVNLPAGGSVTYTASCGISPAATGSLANTATVTAPAGVSDINTGNNSATDTDTLDPAADLSVTKTDGVASAAPGGSTTYTITASNAGPSDAPGATVADTFPAACTTASWTCVPAGGATCTAGPVNGNIGDVVNLPAGGSVTYSATCNIAAAATGNLANTATVTAPAGVTDGATGNNSATDTDSLVASADLGVSIADSPDPVTVGNDVTYSISASNAGPSNATDVVVSLPLPADTGFVSATPSAGASCTLPPTGSGGTVSCSWAGITDTATSRSLDVSATVQPAAIGTLSATATVSATTADANAANNTAVATTAVDTFADLVLAFTAAPTVVPTGTPITYSAVASNGGPGAAPNLQISIVLDPTLGFASATPDAGGACTEPAVGSSGSVVCTWAGLTLPGAAHAVDVVATANAVGTPSTSATATSDISDPTPADAQSSVDVTVGAPPDAIRELPVLDRIGLLLLSLSAILLGAFRLRRVRTR
jgi:uncharacterized repeat protein (TIGR01451 family)